MEIVITEDLLKKYFKGEKKHYFYEDTVKMAKSIAVHAQGEYPEGLIEERRPSESEFIKEYRKKIWIAVTQQTISQVKAELMKIRKADDWSVRYDATKVPASIVAGETPYDYFEVKFPKFKSLTNWTFSVLLNIYLVDPNAVMLVIPLTRTAENVYRRPFPMIFTSENVIEFMDNELCVLRSKENSNYKIEGSDEVQKGSVFFVVDKMGFAKYRQTDDLGNYERESEYKHNLGYLPAFKLKAAFKKQKEGDYLWESRIAGMIPRLDEAVREYSDLQAEVVQHIHSEKWVIETQNCTMCKGSGKTIRQGAGVAPGTDICKQCKGSGTVSTSPYSNMVVKPGKIGVQNFPIPPAGYIQKDVEIVKIQDERIDKHVYKALCAINMQYLDKAPLNESGKAKEVDKDSLNNFVHSVAEDLVGIMDNFYAIGTDYRYMDIVTDEVKRKEMLPMVSVPSKLDILSAGYLVDEVGKLKTNNINPLIVNATEIELANKKFSNDPHVRDMLVCIYELDPLGGYSQDDKMSMLQNKGVTREDYVISCNIQQLVKQAWMDDKKFFSLDYTAKIKKLKSLVAPIIKATEVEIDTTNPAENGGG